MSKGRKPTTGRFDTRKEAEYHAQFLYYRTDAKVSVIARAIDVSPPTADRMIFNPTTGKHFGHSS